MRARKWLARGLWAALLLVTFVVALVVGALVHLSSPPARRLITQHLGPALQGVFAGSIVVEGLAYIGLGGVRGLDVVLLHPDGDEVLRIDDLDVAIDALAVVRSALGAEGPLLIRVDSLRVGSAHVSVASDAQGSLRLLAALATEPSPGPAGRPVALTLPHIELAHAWFYGAVAQAGLVVDADIDDLGASLSLDQGALEIELARATLTTRAMPQGADVVGSLRASLALPESGAPIRASAAFDGTVASAELRAEGSIDGDVVFAELSAPSITPELVRRFVPDAPLAAVASVHATARGTLPKLAAQVQIAAESSTIDVDAAIVTASALSATLEVRGRRLDASIAGGPVSDLDLDGRAALELGDVPRGTFHLSTSAAVVGGVSVPPTELDGSFKAASVEVRGRVAEPSLPLDVSLALEGARATFTVDLQDGDLRALARRGVVVSGRASVHASGSVDLEAQSVDASAKVTARGLSASGVRVGAASIDASVSGALADPAVRATVVASGIEAGLPSPIDARATISGAVLAPRIVAQARSDGLPDVALSTSLDLRDGVRVGATSVGLTERDVTAVLRVASIDLRGGRPALRGLSIDGLGSQATASLGQTPDGYRILAHAERLELARIATLVGSLYRVTAGEAALDVDVTLTARGATGRVRASVDKARAALLGERDASAALDATFIGRRLMLNVGVALSGVGSALVVSRNLAELAGSPLDPQAWAPAEGAVAVEADVDLAELSTVLPLWLLPVDALGGAVSLRGLVDRPRRAEDPSLDLEVGTEGLTAALREPELELRGLDAHVHVRCEGSAPHAAVEAWVDAAAGTLARVEVATDAACRELADLAADPARLAKLPFLFRATVPERALATIPAVVGAPSMPGEVGLTLLADGTLTEPRASLRGRARGLAPIADDAAPRFDADATAWYAASHAEATLSVVMPGRDLVTARAWADGPLGDLVLRPKADVPWTASADLTLLDAPLAELSAFTAFELGGEARGRVTLRDLHRRPQLDVDVSVRNVAVDRAPFGDLTLAAHLEDGEASARLALAQPGGSLRVDGKIGLAWASKLVPEVALSGPIALDVEAKSLRLKPLLPLVASQLDKLDGELDGHLRLTSVEGDAATEGSLSLREGVLQPTGGSVFRDVRAQVNVARGGEVTLEDAYARAGGGELRASGRARIDETGLRDASGALEIAEDRPIPVVLEATELARVAGRVEAKVTRGAASDLRFDVKAPRLVITLPEQLPGSLQSLDPPAKIRIGTMDGGHFVPASKPEEKQASAAGPAAEAAALTFAVALPDVEVKQGAGLAVRLHGSPRVVLRNGVEMTGQIVIDGGTLDLKGREFTLESGTITFTGAPENPDVVLTARWTAPDETVVYADFVGPLKTGKVTLRSDPALPRAEILALILFGRSGATLGDGGGADTQATAIGAAGEVAARGLNRLLSSATDLEIKTRIDTSNASSPRSEVEVQIARDVSLQLATVLGQPLPGQTPDRNYVTLTWALSRAWAIETTVGDQGSSLLDLVWERLY